MYRVQLFLGLDAVEHIGVANVLEDLGLPAVELAPFGSRELAERLAEDRGHLHDDGPVGTLRRFGPLYHLDDWLAAHDGTLMRATGRPRQVQPDISRETRQAIARPRISRETLEPPVSPIRRPAATAPEQKSD
jgi:hypothetical protein